MLVWAAESAGVCPSDAQKMVSAVAWRARNLQGEAEHISWLSRAIQLVRDYMGLTPSLVQLSCLLNSVRAYPE